MKRDIFKVFSFAILLTALGGCSDWTKQEPVDSTVTSFEEQNPELYAQYLESLREYKKSSHRIMYVTLDNSAEDPSVTNEHLNQVPDSVDIVALLTPDNLSADIQAEMVEVRENIGTQVIYKIDYDEMLSDWTADMEEQGIEISPYSYESGTPGQELEWYDEVLANFISYVSEQTAYQIALCDKYGYDGIEFCYTGQCTTVFYEAQLAQYTQKENAFFTPLISWVNSNPDKLFLFRGNPQNILNVSILSESDYIVLPSVEAVSDTHYTQMVLDALVDDVPTDRFLVATATSDAMYNTGSLLGYYTYLTDENGNLQMAIPAAALWVCDTQSGYTKAGMVIENVERDYYNSTAFIYPNCRAAITTMNP